MPQNDGSESGYFEFRRLVASLEEPRRPGYIGNVPYLLILRWIILLGIGLRVGLHLMEYQGRALPVTSAFLAALALAIILSRWSIDPGQNSVVWKSLLVVAVDCAVITVVYFSTNRVQSDTFLFFVLPLILAAEYLPTTWIAEVFVAISVLFYVIIYWLHLGDHSAGESMILAFARVYLGREFFLFGLTCTAWYLFQRERKQQARLESIRLSFERATDEAQALWTFSNDLDQIFRGEDLMRQAVTLATDTSRADWGLGVLFSDDGTPQEFSYTPADSRGSLDAEAARELIREAQQGHPAPRSEQRAVEFLTLENRKLGLLAVGMADGRSVPSTVPVFLQTLGGALRNGLRRSLLVSSLRRIEQATLGAYDFDFELNDTLREATEDLHMEFATITLKDDYRGVVETVRGRNVPPGLLRRSRYKIGTPDIQTHVIETGNTIVLDEKSDLFNMEIFDFFEHHKLARIWVPLHDGREVIGTLEAGCAKERKNAILTKENRRGLEALARRKAPKISALRPQAHLSLIAQEAIGLIAADSASIHVFQASEPLPDERLQSMTQEEFAAHFRCQEPVLAAGAGLAGPEFLRAHAPRPGGIGWKAILAAWRGEADPWKSLAGDRLNEGNPAIGEAGVKAILAVPMRVGSNLAGVLYIHYWRPRQFTTQEVQIERVFAAQIEVAIQSYLLLRNTALAVHDSRSLLDWLSVMQSPATLEDPAGVMEDLAQRLLLVADATNVVLYQYVKERHEFLRPILKGKFLDRDAMRSDVPKGHIAYQLLDERLPYFYNDIADERSGVLENQGRSRFVEREKICSCAMLELRARSDDELFGLLFVNYRTPQRFTREQKNTMQVLAASAAVVIRTARFYEWLKKRQRHIEALRQIDAAIVEGAKENNLDQILDSILTEARFTSTAWAGAVFICNPAGALESRVACPQEHRSTRRMKEGPVGICADTQKPAIVTEISEADQPTVHPDSKSCLAVPLLDDGRTCGVLYVEAERHNAFTADDARILETLAVQAVIARHTIESYRGLERERSRAEALSLVAKQIQNSGFSLDLVLHIILTGITAGESLGFSRAMIFERPEGGNVMQGRSAVGEISRKRACAAWEGIGKRTVAEALDTAKLHFDSGAASNNPLMQIVRDMEVPLEPSSGAVAECVLSRSMPYRILEAGQADNFRGRLEKVTESGHTVPFACIPLVGRKENLGVLVVDNRFQPEEWMPLSPEMIGRVAAYAELAAMSIEASRLLEKTQTQTYEDLAHQLRTPIFKASRYCEDLIAKFPLESAEPASPFRGLQASIDNAIHISHGLQHYADLAKGKPLHCVIVRLEPGPLLHSTCESKRDFEILHRKFQFRVLEEGFSALDEIVVTGDLKLIREALENLLDNAVKYSFPGATIEIGAAAVDEPRGFELYVENVGLAIEKEWIDRLEERGFRGPKTRGVVAEGSGIGLWVVGGIMRTLGGRFIPTLTTPDDHTRMRLWFPVQAGDSTA